MMVFIKGLRGQQKECFVRESNSSLQQAAVVIIHMASWNSTTEPTKQTLVIDEVAEDWTQYDSCPTEDPLIWQASEYLQQRPSNARTKSNPSLLRIPSQRG